ncbi:MAG: hypothetical protein IPG24_23465 [Leptospiraceae bacterium]|nr:hypothetical protein [Leptospiraceae bacterium]
MMKIAGIELSNGLNIENRESYLEITYSWYHPFYWVFLGFSLLMNVMVINIIWDDLFSGNVPILVPSFFILGGLLFLYLSLRKLLNSVKIFITSDKIKINEGPIPTFGNNELDTRKIKQFYCKALRTATKANGPTSLSCQVHAIMNDNTHELILGGLIDRQQSLSFESEVEKFLGLKDIKIDGEIDKNW